MNLKARSLVALLALAAVLIGCTTDETMPAAPAAALQSAAAVLAESQTLPPTASLKSSSRQVRALAPTPTLHPEATPVLPPTAAAQQMAVVAYDQDATSAGSVDPIIEKNAATAVPAVQCAARMPGADLLAVVTKEYGLSKDFAPDDLVALAGHVPYSVTLGYPTEVRQVILQPLAALIDAMISAGLQPQVLSGYRSYAAQAISWNKWSTLYPDRAAIISAQPGHSEHQLGTVIDFGSPELPGLVGQPGIQFHTYFYKTSEGQWLAENAHKYGFTLSFTEEAFDTTGFYYEPWHFRYIGESLARQLYAQNLTLTEYQLTSEPQPCTP